MVAIVNAACMEANVRQVRTKEGLRFVGYITLLCGHCERLSRLIHTSPAEADSWQSLDKQAERWCKRLRESQMCLECSVLNVSGDIEAYVRKKRRTDNDLVISICKTCGDCFAPKSNAQVYCNKTSSRSNGSLWWNGSVVKAAVCFGSTGRIVNPCLLRQASMKSS